MQELNQNLTMSVISKKESQPKPGNPHSDWLFYGGGRGIRTHGRFLAVKRFRVVLVMTTSIALHINFSEPCKNARTTRKDNANFYNTNARKHLKTKGISGTKRPNLTKISSRSRYDHFDTAAYQRIIPQIFPMRNT